MSVLGHSSVISIHAPRGGSDGFLYEDQRACPRFQSTLPVGGATIGSIVIEREQAISIHAPRGGSDPNLSGASSCPRYFNPRSPWGERHGPERRCQAATHFNPRSPWGERQELKSAKLEKELFQSTLPVGGATAQ